MKFLNKNMMLIRVGVGWQRGERKIVKENWRNEGRGLQGGKERRRVRAEVREGEGEGERALFSIGMNSTVHSCIKVVDSMINEQYYI